MNKGGGNRIIGGGGGKTVFGEGFYHQLLWYVSPSPELSTPLCFSPIDILNRGSWFAASRIATGSQRFQIARFESQGHKIVRIAVNWEEFKGCLIKGCLNSTKIPKVGIPKTGIPTVGIPKTGIPKARIPKVGQTHTGTLPETEVPKPARDSEVRDSEKQGFRKQGARDCENGQIHGPINSDTS